MENQGEKIESNDFSHTDDYLFTKEEHSIILNSLYLDLEHICGSIEDNLGRNNDYNEKILNLPTITLY